MLIPKHLSVREQQMVLAICAGVPSEFFAKCFGIQVKSAYKLRDRVMRLYGFTGNRVEFAINVNAAVRSLCMKKKRLLVDFDATLHQYTGWNEGRLAGPLEGARHAMHILSRTYELVCFTTRADRPLMKEAVESWLRQYGFPAMRVTNIKEPCHLCIDDRALCFPGVWSESFLQQVRSFHPHWEAPVREPEAAASESAFPTTAGEGCS